MKISEVEKEAMKVVLACEKLRQKYKADGVKIYLKSDVDFCIKLIKEEHVVRTIRVGQRQQFDTQKES